MAGILTSLAGLSIERLKSFCEIVDAGSVVAASKKNGVAQGQYSRQIRDLERALETKLFTKEGRFLVLTRDGVQLAALTRAYFNALDELAGNRKDGGRPLRLGVAESIMRWVIVPRYTEVLSAVGARLDVENHRTNRIIELVVSGGLDLGIVRTDAVTSELESVPFPTLSYVLMVPREVLPDKSATGIKNVKELPFVILDGDGQFVRNVTRLLEGHQLPFSIVGRVESFSLAVDLAKVMSAATIIPEQATKEFSAAHFASVELEGLINLNRSLALVFSRTTADLNPKTRRAALRLSRLFMG